MFVPSLSEIGNVAAPPPPPPVDETIVTSTVSSLSRSTLATPVPESCDDLAAFDVPATAAAAPGPRSNAPDGGLNRTAT